MSDYSVHPSAVVDEGAEIGTNTNIWHWSHICKGALIGSECNIGQNVFISNIPKLEEKYTDEARRFVYMIDEFYDRNVKVIISADSSIDKLCNIKKINKDFERTKSRLNEMQSSDYMKKEHKQ